MQGLAHEYVPHSRQALYISAFFFAVVSTAVVYWRCKRTDSIAELKQDRSWIPRVAGMAAPIPIFLMLLALPLDPHLVEVFAAEAITVALAGLYAAWEMLNDIRNVAAIAHAKAKRRRARKKGVAKPEA